MYDFSIVLEAIRSTNLFFHSLRFHPHPSHIPPLPSPFLLFHIIILLPQYSSSSNPSLQISPSEMNEGSTLERGNSAKFILSPILLIPRVIGRVRATSNNRDRYFIYIYIFVSLRVYNIIVEFSFSTRVTVAKENRRRRLEILSRFHSLAVYSRLDSTKAVPVFLSTFLSLSLSLSSFHRLSCPSTERNCSNGGT